MPTEFITWLIGQAGIGGIAALALFLLDRSYRDALRREKEVNDQSRADRAQLITVISENAKSQAALQATIENMTREWGRMARGGSSD